ncbi:KilA-N domain-containing protein [Moraxella nasibovis]|uniref:KilA-N domain-containing protein n=1 Tax=Moraxella nasibovis TaxID=2904120 RepID=UPI00240F79EF|nr:KilA-N domain-containing protein [Moraxella nasibovis]WFF39603.1 KilA-N domain-containing protein [Moraxella nasibovis]
MNLIISNQAISTYNGLFSLNDLHKVSGGASKHQPSNFMRNAETQELIKEIELEKSNSSNLMSSANCANLHSLKIKQIAVIAMEGKKGGTYVCRELVYRYAMWISAKFSLMVIRAFDALNTGAIPALAHHTISIEQQAQIQKAVKAKCQSNKLHYQALYHHLYDKFGVKSYKDILAVDFEQALAFIYEYAFCHNRNINFAYNCTSESIYQNIKSQEQLDHMLTLMQSMVNSIGEMQARLKKQDHLLRSSQQLLK